MLKERPCIICGTIISGNNLRNTRYCSDKCRKEGLKQAKRKYARKPEVRQRLKKRYNDVKAKAVLPENYNAPQRIIKSVLDSIAKAAGVYNG